jgi:hypothetical protein
MPPGMMPPGMMPPRGPPGMPPGIQRFYALVCILDVRSNIVHYRNDASWYDASWHDASSWSAWYAAAASVLITANCSYGATSVLRRT